MSFLCFPWCKISTQWNVLAQKKAWKPWDYFWLCRWFCFSFQHFKLKVFTTCRTKSGIGLCCHLTAVCFAHWLLVLMPPVSAWLRRDCFVRAALLACQPACSVLPRVPGVLSELAQIKNTKSNWLYWFPFFSSSTIKKLASIFLSEIFSRICMYSAARWHNG